MAKELETSEAALEMKALAYEFNAFAKDVELATRKLECEERAIEIVRESGVLVERSHSRSLFNDLWKAISEQEEQRADPEKNLDFRVWRASNVQSCVQQCMGRKVFFMTDEVEATSAFDLLMADIRNMKLRDGAHAPLPERQFLLQLGDGFAKLLPTQLSSTAGKRIMKEHAREELEVYVSGQHRWRRTMRSARRTWHGTGSSLRTPTGPGGSWTRL